MIKNLIFDIGGVLIGYRVMEAINDYGLHGEDAKRVAEEVFNGEKWDELDSGLIELEEVVELYKKKYPNDAEHIEYFMTHLEHINVDRPEVWEKVEKLQQMGYGIYLLSNYSENMLNTHTRNMYIRDKVDGRVISYEVHCVKPNQGIYKALLDKYELKPEESIFFDDRAENTAAAELLGIKTITIESREHINAILDDLISGNELKTDF